MGATIQDALRTSGAQREAQVHSHTRADATEQADEAVQSSRADCSQRQCEEEATSSVSAEAQAGCCGCWRVHEAELEGCVRSQVNLSPVATRTATPYHSTHPSRPVLSTAVARVLDLPPACCLQLRQPACLPACLPRPSLRCALPAARARLPVHRFRCARRCARIHRAQRQRERARPACSLEIGAVDVDVVCRRSLPSLAGPHRASQLQQAIELALGSATSLRDRPA